LGEFGLDVINHNLCGKKSANPWCSSGHWVEVSSRRSGSPNFLIENGSKCVDQKKRAQYPKTPKVQWSHLYFTR